MKNVFNGQVSDKDLVISSAPEKVIGEYIRLGERPLGPQGNPGL
jgi:hypothetical protein